jgi:EAL domain-containing protein (putative c-di-GMP-specific phosphodiesterase class I)
VTTPVPAPARATAEDRSVLIVDDDVRLARTLERVLVTARFRVTTVSDGAIALDTIMARSFDVVLSDIQMPEMSGIDLLRVVRAYDLDVPVILMTGDPQLSSAMDAVSLGALQYLIKPVPNEVLIQVVERASRLHRMARMKREAFRLLGEASTGAGDRAGLETRFERALETMWMAFQPIVDAGRQRLFGYEALMRTTEPSLPHPGAVLDAAERLGRLHDVGRHVRGLAARAFEQEATDALLFVNLHTQDLLDDVLYDPASPLTQIADRVVLEVTERSTIDSVKDVQRRVRTLREQGFRIAIDDLGAGYAGLCSFASLEPEIVKLDMSLIRNVHQSAVRQRLIGSMAELCAEMGIRVVAEGVEVAEERNDVRRLGCQLLQGFFYARPGPPFPRPVTLA